MSKALLLSVGGSPAPVALSIDMQKPDGVIYFVSQESWAMVNMEICPRLAHRPQWSHCISTLDGQDLMACVQALFRELPKTLDCWGMTPSDLTGDITGGTKTMAAATALVLNAMGCNFSYVAGTERTKEGLGVVIDGKEYLLRTANPWDAMAIDLLRRLEILFNTHRYSMAAALCREAAGGSKIRKYFFETLADACEGYHLWDRFHYVDATKKLNSAYGRLQQICTMDGHASIHRFLKDIERDKTLLEALDVESKRLNKGETPQESFSLLVRDLLANAQRRSVTGAHDDAMSRLYSAVEKLAKLRLAVLGIDNSNICLGSLPKETHETLQDCQSGHNETLSIGFFKSYDLLHMLGDELGHRFNKNKKEMRNLMNIRNKSILAHGYYPVKAETFEKMFEVVARFADIDRSALHTFPTMNWAGLFVQVTIPINNV